MSKKQQISGKQAALAALAPCVYAFNFKDVPTEKYAEVLDLMFRNPDFAASVEKRNRLVQSAGRIGRGTSEMANLVRTIQQHDRRLADILFGCLVQANVRSNVTLEHLSLTELLRYHVDYSREGIADRVKRLTANLYKTTFLADMLESVVADVKGDMAAVFGDDIEFQQFDGVLQVLRQLRGFFQSVRPQETESPDAKLYLDYSDSINEYLTKRLKTYYDKMLRLHPENQPYTEQDLLAALNDFFGVEYWLGTEVIKHTDTNSPYLDAQKILHRLNEGQARKFQKLVTGSGIRPEEEIGNTKYDFSVTSAVINRYRRKK